MLWLSIFPYTLNTKSNFALSHSLPLYRSAVMILDGREAKEKAGASRAVEEGGRGSPEMGAEAEEAMGGSLWQEAIATARENFRLLTQQTLKYSRLWLLVRVSRKL